MIVRVKRLFGIYAKYALVLGVFVFILNTCFTAVSFAATNPTINFQGRLLNSQGAVVPDGYYNMQFKIYQDGDGLTAGDTTGSPAGTLKWTENWTNAGGYGVQIKNGYMSVELGTVNAFGSQVDWNQSTLWLSMNIGNTNASCTPISNCGLDGEMLPMKRFSSTPYAMNAGMLGGLTAAGFIQNTTVPQTANISVQSASTSSVAVVVSGAASQTADIFQVKSTAAATPLLAIGSSGAVTIQPASDSTSALAIKTSNGSNSVLSVDTQNSRVTVGNATTTGTGLSAYGAVSSTAGYQLNGSNLLTGSALTFTGATGATIQSAQNQTLAVQGGNAATANTNGGNLSLSGGTGAGTGAQGLVVMSTPTFSTTANDANCFAGGAPVAASCTITQSSVDNSSAILVGMSNDGQTATLPDPTILTAGRVVYVTSSTTSKDFTLSVNGGGQGNQIAMRKNTTATMIWNGVDWTAAGASSSTTLQAAYDNTLQSAGGAELVVSKTGATNGLTIRDTTGANAVNGALLNVQSGSAANLFSVNSNVTEYTSNSGAETYSGTTATFPASTWVALTGATVSRNVTTTNIATGQGSAQVLTSTAANSGFKNVLSTSLTAGQHYNVSFSTKLSSGTFTDMAVYYSVDGTADSVACITGQAIKTSVWTKVNCTFTAPSSGIVAANSINIRQAGSGTARTFYVDNISVTIAADYNYASDGGANDTTNFATNWSTTGTGSTVTRNPNDGQEASDSAQAVTTTGGTYRGVRNKLAINPLPDTLYRISVYAKSSTAFSDFTIRYSRDGASFTDCVDYNKQALSTTEWTQITCYVKTDLTAASNPYVYFVQAAAAARTFMVDAFSMTLASNTTPNVQVGSGSNGGPTTLFTLDKGASAPIAANNDALLGSMYYDTTLGKLQCYEADGWGACGSSPDNIITISPEYTNAVLHGTGIGTMTSDICSDYLDINDGTSGQSTICGANETYNFYKWTSPQATPQTYSMYVTYQLPSTFKSFNSGQTSLMGRTDNANSSVTYQIYRSDSGGLTPCGGATSVSSGAQTAWQTATAAGAADPSTCNFTPNSSIVFMITTTASQNANAYIGNLNFAFSNK